jgi:hypothetical protein
VNRVFFICTSLLLLLIPIVPEVSHSAWFGFWGKVIGAHEGSLSKKYYEYAVKMREETYSFKDLEDELKDLAKKNAPDANFQTSLATKLKYYPKASQQNRIIKHFLSTLEDYRDWLRNGAPGVPHKKDQTMCFDLRQLTIEHIHPQNTVSPSKLLNELRNNLGNLTILAGSENSSLGDKPFSSKKQAYAMSKIAMTRDLGQHADWTENLIQQREQDLIVDALKIFAI